MWMRSSGKWIWCRRSAKRWTFWRPLVHNMSVAGAAFPASIQSSMVTWRKVWRTTPVDVGGKPVEWSGNPWWAVWYANVRSAAALSGTIRVLSNTRLPEDRVLGQAKARALIWNTPSPCWKPASSTKRERCHGWLISLVVNRKRRCLKTVVAQDLKWTLKIHQITRKS